MSWDLMIEGLEKKYNLKHWKKLTKLKKELNSLEVDRERINSLWNEVRMKLRKKERELIKLFKLIEKGEGK